MGMGRPKAELVLSAKELAQLQSFARSRSLPAALVRRVKIVLACAEGGTNTAVAQRFETTNATVGKWRRRFVDHEAQVGLNQARSERTPANKIPSRSRT